uniref:Uncharacterized protein n=1 Tax=Romanomermis culicivorax TaxID=13658 RepID=A0A915IM47_ROMCU
MAVDMINFQFAVPMPANSTASSYPRYVQFAFPNISPMYKLAIHNCLQYESDPALPPIPHKVDDLWINGVAANQLLHDSTYQDTHYRGRRLVGTPNSLHAVGRTLGFALFRGRICLHKPFVNSPPSKFRSGQAYRLLRMYMVLHRRQPWNASHRLDEWNTGRRTVFRKQPWNLHLQPVRSAPIIFNEDFQMETAIEQIDINESDYTANPHSTFHFYSHLLHIIDFQNRFLFTPPVLPTTAMLTTKELLDRPTLAIDIEPADEELLDTPTFDLNIAKLLLSSDVLALSMLAATADLTAMTTQITDFLKLTLEEISTLALVPMDESTPVQPIVMDAETNTRTAEQS